MPSTYLGHVKETAEWNSANGIVTVNERYKINIEPILR